MPRKDGYDVIAQLHGEPKVKVIAISGGGRFPKTDALKTARAMRVFAALEKPLGLETLIETVQRALAS